ncbi:MAG TPA: hypothetical protein VF454_01400, partial [Gemmatimonadales bacterium]
PAYDPNYRQLDVEGYRIYRGRIADPAALALVAQFDYATTTMHDFLGAVDPRPNCAPELGKYTTVQGCPVDFSTPTPGNAYTAYTTYAIVGPFVQVKLGDRFLAADSSVFLVAADTAVTGGGAGSTALQDSGVPFSYIDHTAKNDVRYYYAVSAFDVNSIQSGPSSLESARATRSVVPQAPGPNYDNSATLSLGLVGRGVNMSAAIATDPRIDPATGVFSGPARPATGAAIAAVGDFVKQLVTSSGESSLRLDSMFPGSAYDAAATTFWATIVTASGGVPTTFTVLQDQSTAATFHTTPVEGPAVDPSQAGRYGGSGGYHFTFALSLAYPGNYLTGSLGRGCANSSNGGNPFIAGRCAYNGARWFDGGAETFPHPTRGNNPNTFTPAGIIDPTNAGALTGVAHVHEARAYQTRPSFFRQVEGVLGTILTAADYELYWGAGGTVDSVIDVTHNVPLPFDQTMVKGYTWGFLTQAAAGAAGSGDGRGAVLSVSDLGCVAPIHADPTITNAHFPAGLPGYAAADGHLG